MKKFWRFLMVLMVGAGVVLAPGALAGWARPAPPFRGHGPDRDKDKGNHGRGRGHHEHWDNGRHRGWDRDRRGFYRFDDVDRREVVTFYQDHHDERWFREPVPHGVAVGYGYILEPRYRHYCHPLPAVMLRELPPPPPRCHYFLFGGNVLLVDNGYRVQDFIQLNFNIGR